MKTTTLFILSLCTFGTLLSSTKKLLVEITPNHFENSGSSGKELFEQNCSKCHGYDGSKGKFGAKNLQKSTLTNEQYFKIIQKGKGIIPSCENKLTMEQITDITSYIKTFKK